MIAETEISLCYRLRQAIESKTRLSEGHRFREPVAPESPDANVLLSSRPGRSANECDGANDHDGGARGRDEILAFQYGRADDRCPDGYALLRFRFEERNQSKLGAVRRVAASEIPRTIEGFVCEVSSPTRLQVCKKFADCLR
jgi:hypothetical protein